MRQLETCDGLLRHDSKWFDMSPIKSSDLNRHYARTAARWLTGSIDWSMSARSLGFTELRMFAYHCLQIDVIVIVIYIGQLMVTNYQRFSRYAISTTVDFRHPIGGTDFLRIKASKHDLISSSKNELHPRVLLTESLPITVVSSCIASWIQSVWQLLTAAFCRLSFRP